MIFLFLLEKQTQAVAGTPCLKFDSKMTVKKMPRCQTAVANILTIIMEPNNGHDALVDFKETGKKGVEVGETVWKVVQEKKLDDGSILAGGSDAGESSPDVGPHPYLEIKLGYSIQRIFCELHTVSFKQYFVKIFLTGVFFYIRKM